MNGNPIINASDMPAPRLELRWSKGNDLDFMDGWTIKCDYNIVLPLQGYDIRREDKDGAQTRSEWTIQVCQTRSTGTLTDRMKYGFIDTPYRDSAHVKWDRRHLGWPPVYAVCGDKAQLFVPAGPDADVTP